MANLKDVIYLSAEDYNTLYTNGTVTINGTTLTYNADNLYIVPDDTDTKISTALANYRLKPTTETSFSGTVAENTNYILSTAISSLSISSITNSNLESNIIFEVSGSSFTLTLPSNTPMIGSEPTYESGEKYIVSICNGIVIVAPITA